MADFLKGFLMENPYVKNFTQKFHMWRFAHLTITFGVSFTSQVILFLCLLNLNPMMNYQVALAGLQFTPKSIQPCGAYFSYSTIVGFEGFCIND